MVLLFNVLETKEKKYYALVWPLKTKPFISTLSFFFFLKKKLTLSQVSWYLDKKKYLVQPEGLSSLKWGFKATPDTFVEKIENLD
jgi:hypothetical protein